MTRIAAVILAVSAAWTGAAHAGGRYFEVSYPPTKAEGGLQFGVTFTLWLPDGVQRVRGVIVHQHGCGSGACKGGATAAYDLHWQALAKKWDCALLGPSYGQEDKQNCRLWCDPRNGSEAAFLKALSDLAAQSGRPEIADVPWCLWGHSGGGFWASILQTRHADRIVAIWCRSGTAFPAWESGQIPKPEIPDAVYRVPVMLNPGAKEKGDKRFNGAWTGAEAMFRAYRAKGAPVGLAPDPRTGHECGDSRYLAIPYFDALLAMRLPPKGSDDHTLRPVDGKVGWLAVPLSDKAEPAGLFSGKPDEAVWLPNEAVARAWMEYVRTGATRDATPPPAPTGVKAAATEGGTEVTWQAEADFESGLRGFVITRDGQVVAQLPEKPSGRFGRPLWQAMSYHDTPERPLPEMRWLDKTAKPGARHVYTVIAVNGVGLRSAE
jgi:hypothetical protein